MATLPFPCVANPLTAGGIQSAMDALGIDTAILWAVLSVETKGCGFFESRRPEILFERHIFSRLTGGEWDTTAPDVSNPLRGDYGASGDFQYGRLGKAYGLDRSAEEAALQSTSWGLGQILGTNASSVGFATVRDMIAAMTTSEDLQLQATVNFILSNDLQKYLQTKNWAAYANGYNGHDYAKNHYDTNLAKAYTLYQDTMRQPDLTVRAAQLMLMLLGFNPGGIDGVIGSHTLTALHRFQSQSRLALTVTINTNVLTELTAALPPPSALLLS
jgi:hypothetical protein